MAWQWRGTVMCWNKDVIGIVLHVISVLNVLLDHISDVTWAPWCLKPPTTGLFVFQFVQSNNLKNINAPHSWPFVRGMSLTKGAECTCDDVIILLDAHYAQKLSKCRTMDPLCGNQKLSDQQFPRTTVPVMQKPFRLISQLFDSFPGKQCRANSRLAPSQRETSLQSNAVSHWLGAHLESTVQWVLSL